MDKLFGLCGALLKHILTSAPDVKIEAASVSGSKDDKTERVGNHSNMRVNIGNNERKRKDSKVT